MSELKTNPVTVIVLAILGCFTGVIISSSSCSLVTETQEEQLTSLSSELETLNENLEAIRTTFECTVSKTTPKIEELSNNVNELTECVNELRGALNKYEPLLEDLQNIVDVYSGDLEEDD